MGSAKSTAVLVVFVEGPEKSGAMLTRFTRYCPCQKLEPPIFRDDHLSQNMEAPSCESTYREVHNGSPVIHPWSWGQLGCGILRFGKKQALQMNLFLTPQNTPPDFFLKRAVLTPVVFGLKKTSVTVVSWGQPTWSPDPWEISAGERFGWCGSGGWAR